MNHLPSHNQVHFRCNQCSASVMRCVRRCLTVALSDNRLFALQLVPAWQPAVSTVIMAMHDTVPFRRFKHGAHRWFGSDKSGRRLPKRCGRILQMNQLAACGWRTRSLVRARTCTLAVALTSCRYCGCLLPFTLFLSNSRGCSTH